MHVRPRCLKSARQQSEVHSEEVRRTDANNAMTDVDNSVAAKHVLHVDGHGVHIVRQRSDYLGLKESMRLEMVPSHSPSSGRPIESSLVLAQRIAMSHQPIDTQPAKN